MKRLKFIFFTLIIVLLDQASKYLVRTSMLVGESDSVIGELFKITYVQNYGAAFGSMQGKGKVLLIVSLVAIFAVIVILIAFKDLKKVVRAGLTCFLAGGIGNLIDRYFLGYVVDMLEVNIIPSFPVFNVADIFVTVGAILIVFYLLIPTKKHE